MTFARASVRDTNPHYDYVVNSPLLTHPNADVCMDAGNWSGDDDHQDNMSRLWRR
jgi:hypothetical protein